MPKVVEAFVVFLLGIVAVCLAPILYLGITSMWRGNSEGDFQRGQVIVKDARDAISSKKDALTLLADSGFVEPVDPDWFDEPADSDYFSGGRLDEGALSDIIIINSNVNIISNSPGVTITGDEQLP